MIPPILAPAIPMLSQVKPPFMGYGRHRLDPQRAALLGLVPGDMKLITSKAGGGNLNEKIHVLFFGVAALLWDR